MFSLLLLLLSNAVILRRDKSILYSRISIIISLYSCLIVYNNLDFSFLENGIGLFTGFSFSTSVELQIIGFLLFTSIELKIIGLYLLYTIYRDRNPKYFYIFLFLGFLSCFSVFGYIGVTILFLLKSCFLTLYIILYNIIHVKSKNKKSNTCLQNIYLKLKYIIQKIIENFKYIGLLILVSIAIKNSFFLMLDDFYCLQLIIFLAFSLWLPITYINSIFIMYKNKETLNFSLFNEHVINNITINKAILLIFIAAVFGYIKLVFFLDFFNPLLCGDGDDENVRNDFKNKDIVIYKPKRRLSTPDNQLSKDAINKNTENCNPIDLSTPDNQLSKDAINKDILKYNPKRRLSTSDTQLSEDVSNKHLKINPDQHIRVNPNLLITNQELDILFYIDKELFDKYYPFVDNLYIHITDARTIITKHSKHIWVEIPKFSDYKINNYMDNSSSAKLALEQLDSECLEDITTGYVSPLLNTVFKNKYGFGVVPQTGGGREPCDFVVNIANEIRFHHTFIECKRHGGDSMESSLRQLVRYLKESNAPNNVFGIVIKDSFISFFEYHSN